VTTVVPQVASSRSRGEELTLLVIALLVVAGCRSTAPPPFKQVQPIQIAVDAPLSGSEAGYGLPMLNGVRFAVGAHAPIKGFKLEVVPLDDARGGVHNPEQGALNVQGVAGKPMVLGMIGPLHSTVAKAEIPIAAASNLTMITPGATNDCLTKELPYCSDLARALRANHPNNFFRLGSTDGLEGPAMADFAVDSLKLTRVAVASDNGIFGKTVADGFRAELKRRGGAVTTSYDFDPTSVSDFTPFLKTARDAGAQAVYFGGFTITKGCQLRAQMKGVFPVDVPFLSDDGILEDPQCVKEAGAYAANVYASIAGADAANDPGAQPMVRAFRKAFPRPDDYGQYSVPAIEATNVLIAAIDRAVDAAGGKMPTREQVRDEVSKTREFKTVFGPLTFDDAGDGSLRIVSIYECKSDNPAAEWPFMSEIRL
jgi:branched-chain amino acid transport system substrate-binding protein